MMPPSFKELNNRSASADILKSVSILAVVFIHGSYLSLFSPSSYDITFTQLDFIVNALRFCVPVFIFLWAYFTERTTLKKGNGNSIQRLYKLLVPFAFWSLVYFFIIADFKHITIATMFSKYWSGYGWAGQYYFIILFQLLVLFHILRKIAIRSERYLPLIYLISILFYAVITYSSWFKIGIIGKLGYRPFFYWVPYVILGIVYAHKNIFNFKLPVIAILASPLLILAEIYWMHPSTENIYMLPSIFISSIILLSTLQSKLTYTSISPRAGKSIQTLSNSTLGIFCLNPLVIISTGPILRRNGFSAPFPGCSVLIPLISTIFICAVCILLINIIKRIRLGILVAN